MVGGSGGSRQDRTAAVAVKAIERVPNSIQGRQKHNNSNKNSDYTNISE